MGKVFLNGKKILKLGININPEKDIVKIDNKIIKSKSELVYFALNKPKNYITTRNDNLNRKTVMSLVPNISNLKPVGRLDKDTEGLLLLSNDGDFINRLTHPKFECKKSYFALIRGKLTDQEKEKFEKGIKIDDKKTSRSKINIKKRDENQTALIVTIHEGRNRQIRKMFAYFKHPVKYLQRLSVGNIKLGPLKIGSYRKLTKSEINAH